MERFYSRDEEKILQRYQEINLGESEVCKACRGSVPGMSKPVGMWFVGKKYSANKKKVLFVGKNARGNGGGYEEESILNVFSVSRNNLWNRKWPYWSYTREICRLVFGEETAENIAFSNLIKCNASDTIDTTNHQIKQNCIVEMKTLRNEIECLKPNFVIFYTSHDYDDYIEKIFDCFEVIINETRQIGKRNMPWQESRGFIDQHAIHILRVGHPQMKKKDEFTMAIGNWLMKSEG